MKIKLNWIKWLSNASYTRHKLIVSTLLTCMHDFTPPLSPKTCTSETISQTLIQTNQYVFLKKFACNIKENGLAGTSFICNTSFTITWYIVCGGKTCLSWLDRCTAMRIPRSGLDLEISTYPPLKTRRKVPGKRFSTSCF